MKGIVLSEIIHGSRNYTPTHSIGALQACFHNTNSKLPSPILAVTASNITVHARVRIGHFFVNHIIKLRYFAFKVVEAPPRG